MINWKSILSSFNDKPTLLEWLKLVEKALKESVLTSVTTEQDADKANTKLIFNFEDGTQIATEFFPTKGATGRGIYSVTSIGQSQTGSGFTQTGFTVEYTDRIKDKIYLYAKNGKAVESFSSAVKEVTDENTVNAITVNYDDQTSNTFEVSSARGKQGATGVSITGIETVSNEVVGTQTITNLRVNLSNGVSNEIPVYAENGKTGMGGKVYRHTIHLGGGSGELYTNIYSSADKSYTSVDSIIAILTNTPYQHVWFNGADGTGIGLIRNINDGNFNIKLYSISSGGTITAKDVSIKMTTIGDKVTEAK